MEKQLDIDCSYLNDKERIMEKQIPDKYKSNLIAVTIPGVKAFAWTRELLQEFIEDEVSLNFVILGGDVIELIEDSMMKYSNGDGWYIDGRNIGESFSDYSKRSLIITKEYLQRYPCKPNILFIPVMTSEITAGM